MEPTPLHDDVPVDLAWRVGRRIYVACAKNSPLNRALIELGAKWDRDVPHARWIGSGKREQVLPLVLAERQRAQAQARDLAELLNSGRYVALPRDVEGVVTAMHRRAGRLGGAWDPEHWRYALPDDDSRARLQAELDAWLAQQQTRRERAADQQREQQHAEASKRALEQQQARQADAERARRRRDRVLADSGRTAIGETVEVDRYSTRYMNRAGAEATAWQVGTVHRLDDGRCGLVVDRHIRFYTEEQATEDSHEVQLPDNAHWAFRYILAIVEPTDDERHTDAQRPDQLATDRSLADR